MSEKRIVRIGRRNTCVYIADRLQLYNNNNNINDDNGDDDDDDDDRGIILL
jgi:hypothetical protein